MKLMGFLISVSLALNAYVLWRLGEPSQALSVNEPVNTTTSTPHKPGLSAQANGEQLASILMLSSQLGELNSRLESLEQSYAALASSEADVAEDQQHQAHATNPVDQLPTASHAGDDEEWFWSQESNDSDISLSFSATQGLTVNSVVCRSKWCRVEVEDTSDETNDLISSLELQHKIDKSLGRNTVIQAGAKNGRHRVLFIQ